MPDDVNGRITLAVLSNQLVNLQKRISMRTLIPISLNHLKVNISGQKYMKKRSIFYLLLGI